jgi:hypothetical protein
MTITTHNDDHVCANLEEVCYATFLCDLLLVRGARRAAHADAPCRNVLGEDGSIEAVADTNDTKLMAGDISAIPAACIVGTAKRWAL